ncbi:MAG: CHAT domain-containing protein [Bacteroidia bacterium]
MPDDNNLRLPFGEKSSFDMDTADYRGDFRDMIQSRAYRITPEMEEWLNKPISETSIVACLRSFYENAPVGLLIYFFEDDMLKVYFLTTQGFQFQGQAEVTLEEMSRLGDDLSIGLNLNKHSHNRAPRKRGMEWGEESEQESPIDARNIIRTISALLFPEGLGENILENKTEHLIVIPALNIQQIPFAILTPFADDTLFIDKWSYSMAASLYEIARLTVRKQVAKSGEIGFDKPTTLYRDALFVGNPVFSTEGNWILPPLPGAEEEVKNISGQLSVAPEQVLIGPAATLPEIKNKGGNVSILYLATHGIADPENPLDGSGLFFTPTEDNPQGFWSAREIQQNRFSAILVILSACQTGLGQSQDTGVIGLSRAFQLAGAENIIMSLWSVDDNATNSLMQLFMKKIHEPHRFFPCEPLRQAMLEYRKQNPGAEPVYWASFSTFGIPY